MNLPNTLTLLRVLLIPVFIYFLSVHTPPTRGFAMAATGVFFIASLTDWLDGYLARKYGQITKFGKLFDPIADKLLTSAALILLVKLDQMPAWIAIVMIGREFAVTGLRAAASSEGYIIQADDGGKAKMLFQMIAIIALLLDLGVKLEAGGIYIDAMLIGTFTLWVAMVLAVYSGVRYFYNYWDKIGLKSA